MLGCYGTAMSDDLCMRCPHLFDPHAVIATTGDPLEGGVIVCPEPGCLCYATWGINGAEPVLIPDEQHLAVIRAEVQGGE